MANEEFSLDQLKGRDLVNYLEKELGNDASPVNIGGFGGEVIRRFAKNDLDFTEAAYLYTIGASRAESALQKQTDFSAKGQQTAQRLGQIATEFRQSALQLAIAKRS